MIFNPNQVTWTLRKGVKLPFAPQENIEIVNNKPVESFTSSQLTQAVASTVENPLNQVTASSVDTTLSRNKELSIAKVGAPVSINVGSDNNAVSPEAPVTETVAPVTDSSANASQEVASIATTSTATPTPATSTPATSTPATPTPATSTPATSTPATPTPATSTPATSTPATSTPLPSKETSPTTVAPSLNGTTPVVDGKPVDKTILENVKESFPRWKTLPYKLRAKRADLFINLNSDVPFLQSLVDFLKSKGLDIKPYDDSVNYLPSDILLLDKTDLVRQGTVYVLQAGKRAIWNELLIEFGDRLK
ncbi:MAG: hypothetical protein SPE82_05855 [Succinivibrio sp.]|nr:hypothetical protein [Succinivibrio sp.]